MSNTKKYSKTVEKKFISVIDVNRFKDKNTFLTLIIF